MLEIIVRLVPLLLIAACSTPPKEQPSPPATPAVPSPVPPPAVPSPEARVEAAAKKLGGTLKARLQAAMTEAGAVGAVKICATEAPAIAAQVRSETGVTVGRSSLRLRNPGDAGPAWVTQWLTQQGERKAEGVPPYIGRVRGVEGEVQRVILPIAVEAPCLACHGKEVAPDVKAMIAATYPADTATGYDVGDLRGALWGELPLP